MPGWPDVGRADDHQLLEALRRADTHAPASLYDAYADRLSDYAHSLLHDQELAAEAVHDALVTAHGSAHRLKEPVRLRAWLYALTRFQCAARSGGRTPTGGTGPTAVLEDSADPELSALVSEALSELSRHEREALELSARHELSPAEVGTVLGLTSRQASARLARARDQLENSAAAIILARTGRAHCPDLSALVDIGVGASWQDGPLSPMLRKRLSRHISGCKVCTEGRHRHVSAGRLLDMIPIAFPPLSLRRRVIDTCVNPERDTTRTAITEQGSHLDRQGFPVVTEGRSRRDRGRTRGRRGSRDRRGERRTRRATPILLAAACVFGTAGALALVSGQAPASHLEAMDPAPAPPGTLMPGPSEDDTTDPAEAAGPSESADPADPADPGEQATPSPSPKAGPATGPATGPTATTRPVRRPLRTPHARPGGVAALSASCPGSLGQAAGGVITLSARNADVEWTATTSEGVIVAPSRGRLRAGANGRIMLAVEDPGSPGRGLITFRSAAGNPSCRVSWDGRDQGDGGDGGTDTPSDPPTSPPVDDPSASPSSLASSASATP
ncbi:sigma-70 family RNA polymerase sigma factor [Planotetraspora sp. A-T 1434]|uniref:sigma-70 family RNA polymerase sigma factor n=1 Tax=Planotetraspora sp. A-T 1434 TaxID=2979219 RepID=UPI0021C0D11A|nr:sigma-70 family RNA polymerase sigma factor [Planotetraspora sp. A-T 1434]MCT9930889.1 sigma-70 family RNA polymerase sigma factor [Planotetraspora sp. A-T 1434]